MIELGRATACALQQKQTLACASKSVALFASQRQGTVRASAVNDEHLFGPLVEECTKRRLDSRRFVEDRQDHRDPWPPLASVKLSGAVKRSQILPLL